MSRGVAPPAARMELARSLRRAVADVNDPTSRDKHSPVSSRLTAHCRCGLLGIADWLENAHEVSSLGLSRAGTLLAALAACGERPVVGVEMIWWVADAMQVCPPHEWACPMISKLDPERATWTCRRCGEKPPVRILGSCRRDRISAQVRLDVQGRKPALRLDARASSPPVGGPHADRLVTSAAVVVMSGKSSLRPA